MWRNGPASYGIVSIALHWAIAFLFLAEIPLGYAMTHIGNAPVLQFQLYQWHKSIGFLVLALAIPRLLWIVFSPAPHPPAGLTPAERAGAKAAKIALYAFTIAVPLAGWAIASVTPLQIPSFVFNLVVVPNLPLPISRTLEDIFSDMHAVMAYAAGALALLHAAAALRHHLVLRDATLVRMLAVRKIR
jgi:cytochrome b561